VWRELAKVRDEEVKADELDRARTAEEARREFQTETAEGRAYVLGQAETIWRLEEERAYLDRIKAVTAEQVRAAARRYLDPERVARVVFVPGHRP
jgi:zinc protease